MKKVVPLDAVLVPETAKKVFEGVLYDVYQWPQTVFDGSTQTYEMIKRHDTVSVICIVNDQIIVVDDEQLHTGIHQKFPAGFVEQTDPNTLNAAQREIVEETGYSFKNWRLIKVVQPLDGIEWLVYVYLAWQVIDKVEASPGPAEKVTVKLMDFNKVKSKVLRGVGYLGESRDIFSDRKATKELLDIPEFQGREVDR